MNDLLRDIRRVRRLLGPNGEHWCQGHYALNKYGDVVDCKDEDACKWCLEGALFFTDNKPSLKYVIRSKIRWLSGPFDIVAFNDKLDTTWEDVNYLLQIVEDQLVMESEKCLDVQ